MKHCLALILAILLCAVCLSGCVAEKPAQTDSLADTPVTDEQIPTGNDTVAQPAINEQITEDSNEEHIPTETNDNDAPLITWHFDSNSNTLSISGSGAIPDRDANYTEDDPYGWSAFSGGVTTLIIGDGITHIPDKAFYNFSKLTSVVLPPSLESIGYYAFFGCSFTSIDLPESLTEIKPGAFARCEQLISCEIPGSVRILEDSVFSECTSLQQLILNEGIEVLSDSCLWCSNSIESLTIPASVTRMEELYSDIEVLTFLGDCPELPYNDDIGKAYFMYGSGTVYYPTGNSTWIDFIAMCKDDSIEWIEFTP